MSIVEISRWEELEKTEEHEELDIETLPDWHSQYCKRDDPLFVDALGVQEAIPEPAFMAGLASSHFSPHSPGYIFEGSSEKDDNIISY